MPTKSTASSSTNSSQTPAAIAAAGPTPKAASRKPAAKPAPAKRKAAASKPAAGKTVAAASKTTPGKRAAAAPAQTISLLTIITGLNETLGITMTRNQVSGFVAGQSAQIVKHLEEGSRVRMNGCGTFEVKATAARKLRNPATGEEMQVAPGYRASFSAAKDLKASLAKRLQTAA
jgi:DNA-binding protein HU-beta